MLRVEVTGEFEMETENVSTGEETFPLYATLEFSTPKEGALGTFEVPFTALPPGTRVGDSLTIVKE